MIYRTLDCFKTDAFQVIVNRLNYGNKIMSNCAINYIEYLTGIIDYLRMLRILNESNNELIGMILPQNAYHS